MLDLAQEKIDSDNGGPAEKGKGSCVAERGDFAVQPHRGLGRATEHAKSISKQEHYSLTLLEVGTR